MKYITLLKANIKKQKGNFIGILVLFILISVCVGTVFTIWLNSEKHIKDEYDNMEFGDMCYWMYDTQHLDDITEQLSKNENVEKFIIQEIIDVNYSANGVESDNDALLLPYSGNNLKYSILNDSMTKKEDKYFDLKKGEILITPAFSELFDCHIGDKISIKLTDSESIEYTAAGYYEDAMMGSSLMGFKTMMLTQEDYNELSDKIEELKHEENVVTHSANGIMLHIFKHKKDMSVNELQNILDKDTDVVSYSNFAYSRNSMEGFMMILQNIFAAFLIVFVVILLIVAVVIIGHSISTAVEQEFVDIGILKALGFSKMTLRLLQVYQYILAVIMGMIIGVPLSKIISVEVNRAIITTTGILVPDRLPIMEILAVFLGLILFIVIYSYIKSRRIERITPIRAIRNGMEDVYFGNRFNVPIYKKGLIPSLALRQLNSRKRQYMSILVITSLLVFFLSMGVRLDSWIGEDGSGILNAFEPVDWDLAVSSNVEGVSVEFDTEIEKKISDVIERHTDIIKKFQYYGMHAKINGSDHACNVISNPEYFRLLKGRTCKYENEIVITEILSEDLGVKIGDYVTVSYGEKSETYIVSGYYECANDVGLNFAMSTEGFERLASDAYSDDMTYHLKNDSDIDKIIEDLENEFGDDITIYSGNSWGGADLISQAMKAVSAFMYTLIIIFILIVVIMTGSKILYKEKHDMGIYKAVGMDSRKIRLMFSMRFGMVTAIGSLVGIGLSATINDIIVSYVIRMGGISHFSTNISASEAFMPMFIVTFMFMMFSYLVSGKIKRVDLQQLIVE